MDTAGDLELAERWFDDWRQWLRAKAPADGRARRPDWRADEPPPPVAAMRTAALHHPDARRRREALGVLDHWANDESTDVFRFALQDPVPAVRVVALHGLSCERCRSTDLCVTDVVGDLVRSLEEDPSPKVRHGLVPILRRLADRDDRARAALARAADDDADDLVRQVAAAALEGRARDVRSRKALRRRARRRPSRASNGEL